MSETFVGKRGKTRSAVFGGALLVVATVGGCAPSSPDTSSSTHWLRCVAEDDCSNFALGARCGDDSFCVAADGARLAEVVVFEDEFAGTELDARRFAIEVGSNIRNDEVQAYTARTENVRVVDGALVLTARAEPFDGSEYTSGSVNTGGLFSFRFGRIAARLMAPLGTGCSSSFWLTPAAPRSDVRTCVGAEPCYDDWWPAWGDISTAVVRSRNPTEVISGVTYGVWDDSLGGVTPRPDTSIAPVADAAAWHVYALDWGPVEMRWSIDGEVVKTLPIPPPDGYLPEGNNPFHEPFELRLDLAIGGPDQPPAPGEYPQELRIDWVRVVQWQATGNE